jgi:hypothetical protein
MIPASADYQNSVLAQIREVQSRVTITMSAFSQIPPYTNPRTFDDDTILSLSIVEEVSTVNDTIPSNQLTLKLDNTTNTFDFMTLQNMNTILASRPKVTVEFGVVLSDQVTVEWIPMGTFYIDNWKNDIGGMSITFTAHDLFMSLANVQFAGGTYSSASSLAAAIFQTAGITNYSLDPTLDGISASTVVPAMNCRDLLQYLAIAARCTVYQDRYGVIQIKRFTTLDQSAQFTNYATTQTSLFGYASPTNYNTMITSSIHFDDMFEIPEVALEPSIYQLQINVYSVDGSSKTSYVYTNTSTGGQYGQSFAIDNPLITSKTIADQVASWFISESNYNAVYVASWRQNPVMMATDVIIIDDAAQSAKQTRVYKQEFNYEGYLSGTTESRGGI